jgi:hypothetical protein
MPFSRPEVGLFQDHVQGLDHAQYLGDGEDADEGRDLVMPPESEGWKTKRVTP